MIKLKKGDIVDIVAPASASGSKELLTACSELIKWGLVPRTFIEFDLDHPFHSDDDEFRFQDLKRALNSTDSKVIWCLRGGYGSARLLDRLSKLKKPKMKKLLIGYSDITALHIFFNQKWNWETIHGPTISSFSNMNLNKKCFREMKALLLNDKKMKMDFKLKPLNESAKNLKKKILADIVGGNLAIVQTLLGTKFQLKLANKILLIEDVNERGFRIDRMLNHLVMSGILKGCKGVIFGDFSKGLEPDGKSHVEYALNRFANDQKIPVFKSNDFGHGKENRPLLFNSAYELKPKLLSLK